MDILRNSPFTLHVAPFERQFPSALPLRSIGYVPEKKDRVERTFQSLNFSLILSGRGRYRWRDQWRPVQAPCVITQYPGIPMNYGPDSCWEELFLMYGPETYDHLCTTRFLDTEDPIWAVTPGPRLYDLLRQVHGLVRERSHGQWPDCLDRLAELLILETRRGPGPWPPSQGEDRIRELAASIQADPAQHIDWEQCAEQLGMHPATFRRHWARAGYPPPARFQCAARMQLACRCLAETDRPIGIIGDQVGYEDPLHFSRRFRQHIGVSPRQYRRQHQIIRETDPDTAGALPLLQ